MTVNKKSNLPKILYLKLLENIPEIVQMKSDTDIFGSSLNGKYLG